MLPLWAQLERDSVQVILDIQELREVKAVDLDGDGDEDPLGFPPGLGRAPGL